MQDQLEIPDAKSGRKEKYGISEMAAGETKDFPCEEEGATVMMRNLTGSIWYFRNKRGNQTAEFACRKLEENGKIFIRVYRSK